MPTYYYTTTTSTSTYTSDYTTYYYYISRPVEYISFKIKPFVFKPKRCMFCKGRIEKEEVCNKTMEVCTECYRVQE